jgi:hypothetical protein
MFTERKPINNKLLSKKLCDFSWGHKCMCDQFLQKKYKNEFMYFQNCNKMFDFFYQTSLKCNKQWELALK